VIFDPKTVKNPPTPGAYRPSEWSYNKSLAPIEGWLAEARFCEENVQLPSHCFMEHQSTAIKTSDSGQGVVLVQSR
jgi:hypothetical protein